MILTMTLLRIYLRVIRIYLLIYGIYSDNQIVVMETVHFTRLYHSLDECATSPAKDNILA